MNCSPRHQSASSATPPSVSRRKAMSNNYLMGPFVRRFLIEELVADRNLSPNTQKSYRDTIRLLFNFVAEHYSIDPTRVTVERVDAAVIRAFLAHLENGRGNTIATRNQRLAALHSLFRFIGRLVPDLIEHAAQIQAIPVRRTIVPTMAYLDKHEINALLDIPDRHRPQAAVITHYYCFSTIPVHGPPKLPNSRLQTSTLVYRHPFASMEKGAKSACALSGSIPPKFCGACSVRVLMDMASPPPFSMFVAGQSHAMVSTHLSPGPLLRPQGMYRHFQDKRVSPHTIRHTYGSTFAACRRGHQHDSCLVGTRLP